MKMHKPFLLVLTVLISFSLHADKNKKAAKALAKGDVDKAREIVIESLQDDIVNPGGNYLYSLIYTIDSLPDYSIDSAQKYILAARVDWPLLTEKEQGKSIKNGFYPSLFEVQKERIDSLAFLRAVEQGDVAAYEDFMAQFADADKVPLARTKRDSVAFSNASEVNTWQAYQRFYETYPEAEQVAEAQERYKVLIFNDLTKDRKLSSFKDFLRNFPATPFRKEAEEQIFEIMTAANEPDSYLRFMAEYPNSHMKKRAFDFLFTIDQAAYNFQYYSRYTPTRAIQDSLDNLRKLENMYLVPFYENEKYGFLKPNGAVLFEPTFSSINSGYLCGDIVSEFLLVDGKIINRQGAVITEGEFDVVESIGGGLIKAGSEGKMGVWHKSGYQILARQYDDIALLDNRLLLITKGEKAGLATYNGRILVSPQYDDITVEGQFWIFIKDDLLAFTNIKKIAAVANQEELKLSFVYEELEKLPNGDMIGYNGDSECIIDKNQEVVIPMGVQNIYPMGDNWLVKQPFGYRIFYNDTRKYSDNLFPEVEFNSQWLAWKSDTAWALVNKQSARGIIFRLDSAKLINEDVALSFKDLKGTAHFNNGSRIDFTKGDKVYVLGDPYRKDNYDSKSQFLVIENSKLKKVYSMQGKLMFDLKQGSLRYLSPNYLVVENRGKQGIVDTTGRQTLAIKYDGIGQADAEGLVTVLLDGKFGSYHLATGALAAPKYETRARYFNDKLLTTTFKGATGLTNFEGKTVLPFEYEKVQVWNDTLVMAQKEGLWSITSLDGKKTYYMPFINFQVVRDDKEERILKIYTNDGYGVLSSKNGVVLAPTYNDLVNLGSDTLPLYFAEKHVREAEFYVVVYADAKGNPIKSQAFRGEEYDKIFCQ